MSTFAIHVLLLVGALISGSPPNIDPRVDVERYTFRLGLYDETDSIDGEAVVDVRFRADGVETLSLDLAGRGSSGSGMTVTSVVVDDRVTGFRHTHDRLDIDLEPIPHAGDTRRVTVSYSGVPSDGLIISTNRYGDRTFFGDNWPDRAHHWLPVIDHPSDKALVEFLVEAPDQYQVVASGRLVEETDLPNARRLTHWASTRPLAAKVSVIGVARFAVQHVEVLDGVPIETWVYPQDRDAGFYDYAVAEPVVAYFVSRLGAFPYAKLANVQSKTRYGGMENASNIFYSEGSVTGTRSSERLIAHEVAHQWFGDSVTESDWPHVWLSEGFATYLTALYVEHTYGTEHFRALMDQNRQTVVNFSQGMRLPVVLKPLPDDLLDLLSPNSYQKGAWVLHMLRQRVGTDVFWNGLREYYDRYRDANASTDDFRQVMEDVSGQKLGEFFQQWLERPGYPVLDGGWNFDRSSGSLSITLSQRQDVMFAVPIEFGIMTEADAAMTIVSAYMDEREESYLFHLEDSDITDVVLDPAVHLLMESDFGPR